VSQAIIIANSIQPGEYSMGSGTDDSPHNRDSNGNLYVRYLYWNNGAWHRNYNWLDNDFDVQNPAAVSATLFISPSSGSRLRGSFVY